MTDLTPAAVIDWLTLLKDFFFNRTDIVAAAMPWGRPHPVRPDDLDALLTAHLLGPQAPLAGCTLHGKTRRLFGRFRLGSYAPDALGRSRWLCLDFDGGPDHADALPDPDATMKQVFAATETLHLFPLAERSASGHGWHVWLLFSEPVEAHRLRRLAKKLLSKLDEATRRRVEIFPKQAALTTRQGLGNFVWLPGWQGAQPGACRFFCPTEQGFRPVSPADFRPNPPDRLNQTTEVKEELEPPVISSPELPSPAFDLQALYDSFPDWRQNALDRLPLEDVYGPWLTGRASSGGWLECRDPASPSGDRRPSASVADGSGPAERGSFHSFRSGETVSVFSFMQRTGQAQDFKDAVQRVGNLAGCPPPMDLEKDEKHPEIRVDGRQFRDVLLDTHRALRKAYGSPPRLFRLDGQSLLLDSEQEGGRLKPLTEALSFGLLVRAADWVRGENPNRRPSRPNRELARDLCVNPDPKWPELLGVRRRPCFDSEGRLLARSGYYADSRLYVSLDEELPAIPENPSPEECRRAVQWFDEHLFHDFPFVSASDRAHAFALLLQPFLLDALHAPTPLFSIEAPQPGVGKTLLVQAIGTILLGHGPTMTVLDKDESERRKQITALLCDSADFICFDNLSFLLDSPSLASVISSTEWCSRRLGHSEIIKLTNRSSWCLTANHLSTTPELARRLVRVRLQRRRRQDPASFRHADLLQFLRRHRLEGLRAALLLVRAWFLAGQPRGKAHLSTFETWAHALDGLLAMHGISGFLASSPVTSPDFKLFFSAWLAHNDGAPLCARDLVALADDHQLFVRELGKRTAQARTRRFSQLFKTAPTDIPVQDLAPDADHKYECHYFLSRRRAKGIIKWELEKNYEKTSTSKPPFPSTSLDVGNEL